MMTEGNPGDGYFYLYTSKISTVNGRICSSVISGLSMKTTMLYGERYQVLKYQKDSTSVRGEALMSVSK